MLCRNLALLLTLFTLPLFYLDITQRKSQGPKAAQSAEARLDHLLETGRGSNAKAPLQTPSELRIISYNIRWRGGEELRKLIKLFRDDVQIGGAAILGLQEVDRSKKRTENRNTIKLMADELGMYYAWTAPPTPKPNDEEETGVAILSPYPLSDIQRIVLPHEGPGRRRRVALAATVTVGTLAIRFCSVHSETRIPVERKIEQMQAVLHDVGRYPHSMPTVVLGDFNTWELSAVTKTRKLFREAGFQTPFDDQPTFFRRVLFVPLELKLDWIWLRNLEVVSAGIERRISLSDHWPLWIVVKSQQTSGTKTPSRGT